LAALRGDVGLVDGAGDFVSPLVAGGEALAIEPDIEVGEVSVKPTCQVLRRDVGNL
jgi:hypothetical protein